MPSMSIEDRDLHYQKVVVLVKSRTLELNVVSSEHAIYWPTDKTKIADLIDFCITKGISEKYIESETCLEF